LKFILLLQHLTELPEYCGELKEAWEDYHDDDHQEAKEGRGMQWDNQLSGLYTTNGNCPPESHTTENTFPPP
jgi:hypothetical protein